MRKNQIVFGGLLLAVLIIAACSKSGQSGGGNTNPTPASFSFKTLSVNGSYNGFTYLNVNKKPVIKVTFSSPINQSSATGAITFKAADATPATYTTALENNDSTLVITPTGLTPVTKFTLDVSTALKSKSGGALGSAVDVNFVTAIDSTDKFQPITDDQLMDLVQQQTFKYFWDFGHPTSGLARERNTSGDVVTTGGSGFGVMAIVTAISRNFISRADGLARMQKIVAFLKTADTFHGAFPHWMNGATGKVVPFSTQDDGADLVETAYLMQGLLTARQYFNGTDANETGLRNDINTLWNAVEWDWFRQNGQNTLYWHWSPNYAWSTNQQINGWNEAMITYVLAASSTTHGVPKSVYDNGWAGNGSERNGATYLGVQLPLGPAYGGPLFFSHYSFLGINPNGLTDAYAAYDTQNKAQAMINYNYCVSNPQNYAGYSANCWGLTASDIKGGYTASAPSTNDVGVIAPTAAISSLPYTPTQSMAALRFFYYKMGDKIWGEYGFHDAFNLTDPWFADSYLAIDQGPEIIMIENYRTGLLWNLFMSCPEIKTGMKGLGFQSPHL